MTGLQAPEPGPFCTRWQSKMSYINEALKKAQKDKDSGRIGYMHSIGKSGSAERSIDMKYILLISIIILLLVFLVYLKFGGQVTQDTNVENTGKASIKKSVPKKRYSNNIQVKGEITPPKEDITEQDNNELEKISQREIFYKQAVSLINENKLEEAKDIYIEILTQDPGHINSLNDMGVLFLHERNYEDAINYLAKAVKLKPKFANPFYNLACAYSLQNEGEKGMAYLLKAIEVDEKAKDWAKQDPDLENLKEYAEFSLITD